MFSTYAVGRVTKDGAREALTIRRHRGMDAVPSDVRNKDDKKALALCEHKFAHVEKIPTDTDGLALPDAPLHARRASLARTLHRVHELRRLTQFGFENPLAGKVARLKSDEPGSIAHAQEGNQEKIHLRVDSLKAEVREMRIAYRNGNRTRLVFEALKEGEVAAARFDFVPPAGTAVDKMN